LHLSTSDALELAAIDLYSCLACSLGSLEHPIAKTGDETRIKRIADLHPIIASPFDW
jgi:hypothetical protein